LSHNTSKPEVKLLPTREHNACPLHRRPGLMMFREIIAVYCVNRMNYIDKLTASRVFEC
jgi:hypothetical protein